MSLMRISSPVMPRPTSCRVHRLSSENPCMRWIQCIPRGMRVFLTLCATTAAHCQRILTSVPVSIESADYKYSGNSHGCGQISTLGLSDLTLDMSINAFGGGAIQCPRCFVLHHAIKLSVKACHSPPRTAKCQETGQCPSQDTFDIDHRLNEYVFINVSNDPVFVGSDASGFSNTYPSSVSQSDSVAIAPNSARSAICYQGRFFWP